MLVATSGCLLGKRVRYDGTDKYHQKLFDYLNEFCRFEPVCPEHLAFGTPRPTIDVMVDDLRDAGSLRVQTTRPSEDVTDTLLRAIEKEIQRLQGLPLSGMILKARSPSCGIGSAPYYKNGVQIGTGHGLFAKACAEAFPSLPMIDEEQLNEPQSLQLFIAQMTAYQASDV
jgi:uncharacterized protein YbbK (DUF523 family)